MGQGSTVTDHWEPTAENRMITLIGTCHVLDLKEQVRDLVLELRPEAVCVELDEKRYNRLMGRPPSLRSPLLLVARLQERMAARYGVRAGNDMMGGVEGSRLAGAPLFLIDEDIDAILARVSKALVGDFLTPVKILKKLRTLLGFSLEHILPPPPTTDWIEALLEDFQQDPQSYPQELEEVFPRLKEVIFDWRERNMAAGIRHVAAGFREIAVVVGFGHLAGLMSLLAGLEVRCMPLLSVPPPTPIDPPL